MIEGQANVIAVQVDLAEAGADRPAAFSEVVGEALAMDGLGGRGRDGGDDVAQLEDDVVQFRRKARCKVRQIVFDVAGGLHMGFSSPLCR